MKYKYRDCKSLTSITIPNSVTSLGDLAFNGCSGLTSVIISNGMTCISNNAFSSCSSLTSITIPDGVTSIEINALGSCTSLSFITIPSSITYIADHAFWNCISLMDVYCYAEETPITHRDAFGSNIGTMTLHVPKTSVESYKKASPWSEFGTIVPLEDEIEDDTYIDGIYYYFMENEAEVTNGDIAYSGAVVIPAFVTYQGKIYSVTCIGNNAFADCSNMTSIKIPSTLKRIKAGAFKNCTSLSKIIVTDIASWCGIIYEGNTGSDFPMYYAKRLYSDENTEIEEVIIPEDVTRIEAMAFRDAKYITSITIPKSVTYIGQESFRGMHRLTSIVFPQDITSIEPYACQDCEALASVIISEGVTSIGNNTFAKCYELKDFYCYAGNVPIMGSNVFKSSSITSATLHVPMASVEAYRTTAPWSGFGSIVALPHADYVINDETTSLDIEAEESGNVIFTHDFNGEWEALYLPFAIDYDAIKADFDLAEIDGVVQNDDDNDGIADITVLSIMGFKGQMTVPNKPYLIRAKNAGEQTIVFDDVTVYPTEEKTFDCSSFSTKYEFTGSYNTLNASALANRYIVQDGELVKGASSLSPCRWYMTATARNGASLNLPNRIRIMPVEDVITGSPLLTSPEEEGQVYNLAGQHLNKMQRGINIKNGKKIVMK